VADDISARIGIEGGKEAIKTLTDVGKAADKIDGLDPKIKVGVDAKKADRDIEGLLKKVDKLDADSGTILLTSNATQIANEITDLITDLDKLDSEDPQVDVKANQIADLKGDLDTIEGKLKEINNVPIDIDTKPAQDGIRKVGDEADQSRSVLANMAGNAAQDLGALGGVAGTAGVAIGQLAEYATEGNINLTNLAKVAGPMVGLAVATAAVTYAISAMTDKSKESEKQTAATSKAVLAQSGAMEILQAAINGIEFGDGTSAMEQFTQALFDNDEEALKAAKAMGALGQDGKDLGKVLLSIERDSEGTFKALFKTAGASDDLAAKFAKAVDKGEDFGQIKQLLIQMGVPPSVVDSWKDQILAMEQLNDAQQNNDADTVAKEQLQLAASLGEVNRKLIEQARIELGPDAPEFEVWSRYVELLEEVDPAAADAARASSELATAEREAADATEAHNAALQTQIDRLLERAGVGRTLAEADVAAQQALSDYATVLAEWDKNVKEAGTDQAALNELTWAGRDSAVANADAIVEQAIAADAANGVTTKQSKQTEIWNDNMIRAAASAKGPLKQSILDYIATANGIEPTKVTEISALIEQGKIDEAILILDDASKTRDAQITAEVVGATAAQTTLDNIAKARIARVNVQIVATGGKNARTLEEHGGTAGPAGGIAGEAGPEFVRTPGMRRPVLLTDETLVPPGTRVTSAKRTREILRGVRVNRQLPRYANGTGGSGMGTVVVQPITLNAGVVGNRFDVMRAVARAQRDGARVLGTRR
jgi:hypothetical protein